MSTSDPDKPLGFDGRNDLTLGTSPYLAPDLSSFLYIRRLYDVNSVRYQGK